MAAELVGGAGDSAALDNLYSVILQCFVVILFGYLAGRTGLITSSQSSGIGSFVSKFSLPALLLKNMIELDFSQVNWIFLLGILIAKGSVFLVVMVFTLLIKRNLGYAGIFGIFCTQSNDFAVGYPILQALYGDNHREYLNYLYLVAPISLVVLNPIGFILMEIQKTRSEHSITGDGDASTSHATKALARVLKGVLTNPIVLMTLVGIGGHFALDGKVPSLFDNILQVLGNAYNATALFVLGLSMVGKIEGNVGYALLVPILLITVKTLILPLIIWEVVGSLVDTGNSTSSLSMYGFIYGTFPAAPSVFLYANDYNMAEDIIARGIVLGTFLSAPLMFVSAKMMTMAVSVTSDHSGILSTTRFDISIISLVFSAWVIAVFIFGGKWRLVPHRFSLGFIFSQIMACLGMVLYYSYGKHSTNPYVYYPIVILILVGIFSARVWTAIISLVMCLLHTRSLCYVLRKQMWFWFAGFGMPVFLTGILFLVGHHDLTGLVDPTFHFGTIQVIVSAGLLAVCIIITLISIVVWQRKVRLHHSLLEDKSTSIQPNSRTTNGSFDECVEIDGARDDKFDQVRQPLIRASSIEDIMPSRTEEVHLVRGRVIPDSIVAEAITERTCLLVECTPEQRQRCIRTLRGYVAENIINEVQESQDEFDIQNPAKAPDDYQSGHHLVLLLLLLLSMFVGLFMCLWRLGHKDLSGIHLEVEFLDSFLIYGQGIICLAVFGFDTKLVLSPLVRRRLSKYRLAYGICIRLKKWAITSELLGLLRSSQQEKKTRQVCKQFNQYHKDSCRKEIVEDYSSGDHANMFTGSALCHWLLRAGLAGDKDEAVEYGRYLLRGRVIAHPAVGKHHFQDASHLYKFVGEEEEQVDC